MGEMGRFLKAGEPCPNFYYLVFDITLILKIILTKKHKFQFISMHNLEKESNVAKDGIPLHP